MSKGDFYSLRKRNNSEIERVLFDYLSAWNGHDDRRNYCPRQRLGDVDCSSFNARFTTCALAWKNGKTIEVFPRMKREINTHINQGWKYIICKSENGVSIVVLGVTVDTSRQSDANAASGDRPPTASRNREQDIPDWTGRWRIWVIRQCW